MQKIWAAMPVEQAYTTHGRRQGPPDALLGFFKKLRKNDIVPGWRYLLGDNRLSHLIFHTLFPDHRRCYNRSVTNSHYKTFLNGD
jgi:hypothetical protein